MHSNPAGGSTRSAQNADQNEPKSNQSNRQKPEITGQDHQSRVLRSLQGYDADWFRDALEEKGIKPCIPGLKSRGKPVKYDKRKYKRRNRIEIMFGRLKDWRRVATRYDRCPTVFFSAICLAATVMFWL